MVDVRIIPSTDPRLGRHVEHDERSRRFAFVAPADLTLVSKRHERKITVLDQGNLGSCTGNAGIGALGSNPFYATLSSVVSDWSEDAAVKLYSEATVVDGAPGEYPPEDTGSSGLAIAKSLKTRGWISGYQHTFSIYDMQAALQNGPVIIGINWYNNFFDPDASGNISVGAVDHVAGGHEVCVDQIDFEQKRYGFTNSWGTGWGVDGRAFIDFDLMARLLTEDGDVTVFTPISAMPPAPTDPVSLDKGLWKDVESWTKTRHTGCNKYAAAKVKEWALRKGLTG